jgi:hypothetical protein
MEGLEAETSLMEGLEAETSPMEGLEDINIQPFVGIPNMRKIVKLQYDRLQKGDSDQQYLVFRPVRVDDLAKIDRARGSIGKHIRLAHYTDIDLLIVKLPTAQHESAHRNFGNRLIWKVARMGIPDAELHDVGATRYSGRNSSKEGDSAYRPYSHRPNSTDWPTIVIESGVSESLRHLRFDADWWLRKSGGDVKIVIIISVNRAQLTIQIEKWELGPRTGRQLTFRSTQQIPTKIQEITIVSNTVTGAPLNLEFDKIFLRPAVLPESDITFTAQDFSAWAARIW